VVSGVLFFAGWAVEGFTADQWLDTFVNHSHDSRASLLYALAALTGLWPMWPRALASIRHLRLDMHVLVCVSVIGAAAIGEWSEGAAVAFLFALAHRMEAWSIERARAEIAAVIDRGAAAIIQAPNQDSGVERWIERFASVYTPAVTGIAIVVALVPPLFDGEWSLWLYRALVFLVLGCPCALIISTPVTVVAALSSAARRGVLIRGGAALERAAAAPQATIDAGDVVLAPASNERAAFLVAHARRALHVIRQNVAIALLTKLAFLVAAPFGIAPLWMAVLADTGATVIVTLNALRLLRAR
jgi:cation transport ATPase